VNLEKVEEDGDVLKLKLEDANDAVANALRRGIMVKVPTLAVQTLQITKNGSGLFDETLANRVGQVPFTVPQKFNEEDTLHVAVKKEGPARVTGEDLQTDNEEAEPVNDVLLVKLKEGQDLEFEAEAELGYGDEHAKHQGGTVGYEKTGEGEYEFRIESSSGYSNEELVEKALEQIQDELEEAEDQLL
jgi:DNA-directed RNA polymerase subunit D